MHKIDDTTVKSILINGNISLRPVLISDAQNIFDIVDAQRAYLGEWLPFVRFTVNTEDTLSFVRKVIKAAENEEEYVYVIEFKGKLAGLINLRIMSHVNRIADIGYWLSLRFQKNGIVSNCVIALCNHAFNHLHLNRIQIRCGMGNMPSKKVPLRLGFTFEGIIREGELLNGGYIDLEIYSLLKKERHKLPVWL
ncbi:MULTISPECIES: GNAT family N-acetyltransferase [unclassified Saccharicrinis]|uniref:GNAT family N-acetyltransferase n=1 Tax=unclassified Saccharicrinis TaxID=2646859 RepID=UPI003D32FA02